MKLVGLTGRSGVGKSVVSRLFAEYHGIPGIDCDKLSRAVCSAGAPCTLALAEVFGEEILEPDGTLRRRTLADRVFGDAEQTALLNAITHKYILAALDTEINEYAARGVVALILDAPTLFESGLARRCDVIVSVLADDALCVERICKRDGITPEQAKKRLYSQPNDEFYLANSDYIIYNTSSEIPMAQIREIAAAILQ